MQIHAHQTHELPCGRTSRHGVTLLELMVAVAVLLIVGSSVTHLFSSMTNVGREVGGHLEAQKENHRALKMLLEDLQMVDSLGTDELGVPMVQVFDQAPGVANILVYRMVEGAIADPGNDSVQLVLGPTYRVSVDADGNLIRTDGTTTEMLAARTAFVRFSVTSQGLVEVLLRTWSGIDAGRIEIENRILVKPENQSV